MTRAAMASVAPALALCGCASILGLDSTTFDQRDASIDAANVCDGAPACVAGSDTRTVCGQIRQAGASAGVPLRATVPTGLGCGSGGQPGGPCALAASAFAMSQFFAGGGLGDPVAIDDCGRYAIGGVDPTITDLAIVFTGSGFVETATLVNNLDPTMPGIATGDGLAVTTGDQATWSTMLGSADVSTGFLATYTADAMPLAGDAATTDGNSAFTNPAGSVPWAAYYGDAFGSFAGSATETQASGAALVVPGGGTFQLAGVRTGRRCKLPTMQQVPDALLVVTVPGC